MSKPVKVVEPKQTKMTATEILATVETNPYTVIRASVRAGYAVQRLRIQLGNRICAAYRKNTGLASSDKEEEIAEASIILKELRNNYNKIMDGLQELPSAKKFLSSNMAVGLITDYSELLLMEKYVELEQMENKIFNKDLDKILDKFPVYTEFLAKVNGCGPAISAILISEIDISKATYASSLFAYSGLDVVDINNKGEPDGRGRGKFTEHMVEKHCINEFGEDKTYMGLSHKRFLKTKLVGILGPSFLKCNKTLLDGMPSNSKDRLALAISMGFDFEKYSKSTKLKALVNEHLNKNGHTVVVVPSEYGQIYYDYKNRQIQRNNINQGIHDQLTVKQEKITSKKKQTPSDKEELAEIEGILKLNPVISDKHIHNRAIRYCVKRFLIDYYYVARTFAGLPVTEEYAVRVLKHNHLGVHVPIPELVKRLTNDSKLLQLCKTKEISPGVFDNSNTVDMTAVKKAVKRVGKVASILAGQGTDINTVIGL